MGMTMRVSLPGINALTDGTIDNYALYADSDNVLIKEYIRGTIGVGLGNTQTVTHNLGYIPLYFVFGNIGGGTYMYTAGKVAQINRWNTSIGTSSLTIINNNNGLGTVAEYFIFYDNAI